MQNYSIYLRAYALYLGGSEESIDVLLQQYDDHDGDKEKVAAAALGIMHASMELDVYDLVDFNDKMNALFDTE